MKCWTHKKLKFKKHNGLYFQHKDTDGELVKIENQGSGKEIIVIRSLYKKNNKTYKQSLDIRYFTRFRTNDRYYTQTRDGIQIKRYNKWEDWLGLVVNKIMSVLESVYRDNSVNVSKYEKTYKKDGFEISKFRSIEEFI